METKKLGHGGSLEGEDMIYPGNWSDGRPVGAYFGVQMVCYRSAGVTPSHLVGPAMESRVCAAFVGFQPAGVEVSHKDCLIDWVALVFVRFLHD